MLGAFKFFRMEPRTLHISGSVRPAGGELLAEMVLRSVTQPVQAELPAQVKEHFRATVRLQPRCVASQRFSSESSCPGEERLTIRADEVYSVLLPRPGLPCRRRGCSRGEEGGRTDGRGPAAIHASPRTRARSWPRGWWNSASRRPRSGA